MSAGTTTDKESSVDSDAGIVDEAEMAEPAVSLSISASSPLAVTGEHRRSEQLTGRLAIDATAAAAPSFGNMDSAPSSSSSCTEPNLPRPRANTGSTSRDDGTPTIYQLTYYGNVVLDRRITQPMLTWIVDEKKRNGANDGLGHVILLQISLKGALGISERKGSILFEHRLNNISRFTRGHDKKCFGYLWRPDSNSNFRCFVFRSSEDDGMVHDVVSSIRGADKENLPQSTDEAPEDQLAEAIENIKETNSNMFEVMYCGRISVSHKRAPPTFIDESIEKFKDHEAAIQRRKRHFSSDDRVRSASDGATRKASSLDVVTEDEARAMSNIDLSSIQNVQNNNSNGAQESLASSSSSLSSVSSTQSQENVDNKTTGRQFGTLLRMDSYTKLVTSKEKSSNRTMVFQIGRSMLTVISLDKKSFSLTKKFSEISFCSQGIKQPEYFGFICREKSAQSYMCYVFKCQSESVVDCIMNTLRQAFNAALQHNKLHVICETCPMHQLHKLCQEVEGQSEEEVWNYLQKQISCLGVTSNHAFALQMKNCQVNTQQEQNHLAMMFLMKACEQQQQAHVHISDSHQQTDQKQEFFRQDSGKPANSKFESLKKAKKSLASSFENLLSRNKTRSIDKEKIEAEERTNKALTSSECPSNAPCPTQTQNISSKGSTPSPNTSSSSSISPAPSTSSDDPQSPESTKSQSPPPRPPPHPHLHHLTKRQSAEETTRTPLTTPTGMRQRSKTLGDVPLTPPTPVTPSHKERDTFQFEGEKFKALRPSRRRPPLIRAMSVGAREHMMSPATPFLTPNHRKSWRQAIYNRVVTPMSESKAPPSFQEEEEEGVFAQTSEALNKSSSVAAKPKRFTSRLAVRALWQRAIREQIILNRMDNENKRIKAGQDAMNEKKMKLDYEEITPCLKEVTKQWDKLIALPNRAHTIIPYEEINKLFKEGVPRTRRGDIWVMLSEQRLLRLSPGSSQPPTVDPYPELLKQLTTHQHAILIDLGRTYPNHPYFCNPLGRGQLSLFNLLKAYSLVDDEVGYCQGLSFVAGILLMHMEEEDAFHMLKYLMFSWGFRRQYTQDMTALQVQMYQLSRLLHDFHFRLHDHLEQNEVAPSLYAAPWFLTFFASQFPLGFVSKVFDLIFLQGFEVIFKVALVILGMHEELILQCDGFESIIDFVKNQLPSLGIVQMEKVINKAYNLDISKQLHAYEVEYHVIQEEMLPSSPFQSRASRDLENLEATNRKLRRQNNELIEQLQAAHNTTHDQKFALQTKQESYSKLQSELRTMNLERAALLDTIAKLRSLIPDNVLNNAGIDFMNVTSLDSQPNNSSKEGCPMYRPDDSCPGSNDLTNNQDSVKESLDNQAEQPATSDLEAHVAEAIQDIIGGSHWSELSGSATAKEADAPSLANNEGDVLSA